MTAEPTDTGATRTASPRSTEPGDPAPAGTGARPAAREEAVCGPEAGRSGVAVVGGRQPRRIQPALARGEDDRESPALAAPKPDEESAGRRGVVSASEHRPDRADGHPTVRRSVFLGVLVAAIACAAAAVGFGLAWANLEGTQQAARQVLAVSRAFVLDLTNLTPSTVDQRITDLLDASTGSFAAQAKSFFDSGSPPVRDALIDARAVEQGQIRSLDVEAVNGSTASSFAVVDVSYTNDKLHSPQSDVLRLQLDLVKTAQGWRVSDVTVLDGATGGVLQTPASGG